MKKFILILLGTIVFIGNLCAQESATNYTDSSANQILNELQIIRGIHEESRIKRERAVAERYRRDSMENRNSQEDLSSDYSIMARIEDNTHQRPYQDGWNFYGIVAFIVSLLSLIVSWYTFYSQRKTEGNTKKLSKEMQRKLLNELLRHLYRNLVIVYTMRTKLEEIDFKGFPSEEHFKKLKIPMENIHLDAFYGNDDHFQLMHILYLNLRNYNEEIDVAESHLLNSNLSKETKISDLDTLEFKVSYLTGRIVDTIKKIWGSSNEIMNDIRKALQISLEGHTNAEDNIDVEGSENFKHLTVEEIKNTSYSKLYESDELDKFCSFFNEDVHQERMKNNRGAWKIRIIKF